MRVRTLLVVLAAAVSMTGLASPADALPGEPATLRVTINFPSYGTGFETGGTASGTFTGVYFGTPLVEATFTATFDFDAPDATCPLQSSGVGNYTITGGGSGFMDYIQTGSTTCWWIKLPDWTYIHSCGLFAITSPLGNPCGASNVTATFAGAGAQVI